MAYLPLGNHIAIYHSLRKDIHPSRGLNLNRGLLCVRGLVRARAISSEAVLTTFKRYAKAEYRLD